MNFKVKEIFDTYPEHIREVIVVIRNLIFHVAREDELDEIEETLKWGEPSYLVKGGSTVRIHWKEKYPDQVFIYFNCKTTLIEVFREIYGDLFKYDGNRAIILDIKDELPLRELSHCIGLSLRYHKIKHLPLLGG